MNYGNVCMAIEMLAEHLPAEPLEILGELTGTIISEEDAGEIREYMTEDDQ